MISLIDSTFIRGGGGETYGKIPTQLCIVVFVAIKCMGDLHIIVCVYGEVNQTLGFF